MAKITKLYNEWLRTTDLTLGTKELKFGLTAFEAGYKAASKLNESYGIHTPEPENKKIALVTVDNDSETMKLIIGYDASEEAMEMNMFDGFEEMAGSILGGTFGSGHGGFKVSNIEEMSTDEFETIVGEHTADMAYNVMESRDYFYTIATKGGHSDLARIVQMEDEADDDFDDFD